MKCPKCHRICYPSGSFYTYICRSCRIEFDEPEDKTDSLGVYEE